MRRHQPRSKTRAPEAGITLLLALFVLVLLSGIVASMAAQIMTESRVNSSYRNIAQSYYSAQAGLEEGRARLVFSAPDALPDSSLPQGHLPDHAHVAYIINGTAQDPVDPNDPGSPYFDSQYRREFPVGGKRSELHFSVQPNAQTSFAIPYKWVRITMKTEYSSRQDVNQDGVVDQVTPIVFNGRQQRLASEAGGGQMVYKVTTLAVEPGGMRRLLQSEVASGRSFAPPAALAAGGRVEVNGAITVSGLDNCASMPNLYGILSAGDVKLSSGATVLGEPAPYQAHTSLPAPTPTQLLEELKPLAIPILDADPSNVSFDSKNGVYEGSWVSLGDLTTFPPSGPGDVAPALVYTDHSLSIQAGEGAGILLVNGDLQISGTFKYYGLIVATGAVTIQGDSLTPVQAYGSILEGGTFAATAGSKEESGHKEKEKGEGSDKEKKEGSDKEKGGKKGSTATGVELLYDSCALALGSDPLPKAVLAFKELEP